MAIPDFQTIMLPLLRSLQSGVEQKRLPVIDLIAQEFNLTESEKRQMLPGGSNRMFANRVHWAGTYLKKAGLLHYPRRGFLQITDKGKKILEQNPAGINIKFLKQFEEFREFHGTSRSKTKTDEVGTFQEIEDVKYTPEEVLETSYNKIRNELALELIEKIQNCPPSFFEKLVIDLLIKMGYGGSRKDAGEAVGQNNDEGVDGIIKEDRLGLDVIYIQAKRWKSSVGRPEVQNFVGALEGKRAKKGIFITTSNFASTAHEYVKKISTSVILIDGTMLANLMIDFGIGVSEETIYVIKRLDSDYFSEE